MAVPLIARKSFVYAGRRVKPGQEFDARTSDDARVLKAIGHAGDPPPQGQYETRVMTPRAPAIGASRGLDDMDIEELRAEAARLGVRVHHFAGAERIRAAIREAQS
jgi:hypothetical protein